MSRFCGGATEREAFPPPLAVNPRELRWTHRSAKGAEVCSRANMKAPSFDRRTFLAAGINAAVGLAIRPAVGQSPDLAGLTLKNALELLRSKGASSVELTRACL